MNSPHDSLISMQKALDAWWTGRLTNSEFKLQMDSMLSSLDRLCLKAWVDWPVCDCQTIQKCKRGRLEG